MVIGVTMGCDNVIWILLLHETESIAIKKSWPSVPSYLVAILPVKFRQLKFVIKAGIWRNLSLHGIVRFQPNFDKFFTFFIGNTNQTSNLIFTVLF